jgi:hypothetical protein
MIKPLSMPTKQWEEAGEATVVPEERDVEFVSLGAISKQKQLQMSIVPAAVR